MNFYPVYRLSKANGSFSRIGSLLGTFSPCGKRITPQVLAQLMSQFEQQAGDTILLGPRCWPDETGAPPPEDR